MLIVQSAFACVAGFNWLQSPVAGSVFSVDFKGTSLLGSSYAYSYSYFTFGDGSSISPASPSFTASHIYAATGTYTAKLFLATYDSATSMYCYDSVASTVTVAAPPCASWFIPVILYDSVACTAHTPAGTSGMTYTWDFGDGSSTITGSTVGHRYVYNGTYSISLTASSSSGSGCTSSVDSSITITDARPACSTLHASFSTATPGGFVIDFSNTSTAGSFYKKVSHWSFGDGDTSTTMFPVHSYKHGGSYTVWLKTNWVDTITSIGGCQDSISRTIFLNDSLNSVSGYIYKDSLTEPIDSVVYKVWLISYDTVMHTVVAVDSLILEAAGTITTKPHATPYMFINVPAGLYMVKAKVLNGFASGSGYVPTYSDSSIYWSGGQQFLYFGGAYSYQNIWMQHGTLTSGPGFVAGNVVYGAGKTTGSGPVGSPVAGLQIMLRDIWNHLVSSTYTDSAGIYKLSNVPYGTYSVYPEDMGYRTIAWGSIDVTSAHPHINDIDFTQNSTTIKPGTATVDNVAADNKQLLVYPNPANNVAVIVWPGTAAKTATVTIINIAGQRELTMQLNTDGVGSSEINVSQLSPGLYFMNVISGDMHYMQKLSVRR